MSKTRQNIEKIFAKHILASNKFSALKNSSIASCMTLQRIRTCIFMCSAVSENYQANYNVTVKQLL